jgi:ABC-2 type transport system permease protein
MNANVIAQSATTALQAGRAAMAARPDWWSVFSHGSRMLLLAAFAVWLSLRTFRSYQKSV